MDVASDRDESYAGSDGQGWIREFEEEEAVFLRGGGVMARRVTGAKSVCVCV